tara:strand:+ start:113 stop:301 length:189 start_codon:yes stop_codon:yes gene_type:complete
MIDEYRGPLDAALERFVSSPTCDKGADHFGGLISEARDAGVPYEFLNSYVNQANDAWRGRPK